MTYRVLTDSDLGHLLTVKDVVRKIEDSLRAKAEGGLVAPPRFHVDAEQGSLVFTAGAETKNEHVIGFRVYDTFGSVSAERNQLTAVFDSETGAFKGMVISASIGGMRTGAIGGVAIKYMSRPDSKRLGILGSGFQARFQLEAAAAVRQFERVKVYSPSVSHRELFAAEMSAQLALSIEPAASAEDVVQEADVLICATNAVAPIFDEGWLRPGVHINTIGPKFADAHEVPIEAVDKSTLIATDSLDQVDSYSPPFFLLDTPHKDRMIELSDIVSGKQSGRTSDGDVTLFCSVGLAGTEVVVANEALRLALEHSQGARVTGS